jgi:dTDP-glucose 4,6-dehydratase
MTKYCVLGSNAFSGQDFVDLLLDDPEAQVVGISRSAEPPPHMLRYRTRPPQDQARFRFHRMDMNTDMPALLDLLDREKPDYIVNFAAQSEVAPSWEHPDHWFRTNTVALAKLVNHLRERDYPRRYLHISSPEVYGTCTGTITETAPFNPSTPYAASKAAADMLLEVYRKQFGFPLLTVRATNVYGARQQLFKIVNRTAIYLKLDRTIQLHGGGHSVKSYIHVRDVSRAELDVLHRGTVGELYHISPDAGIAVRDVVAGICALMGRSFEESTQMVAERPGQDAAYVIDSTKLRALTGWTPQIPLTQGLQEVIDWVDAEWDSLGTASLDYQHKA